MHTSSSLLSVLVLTVGMTVFILSGVYVSRETSVDAFHENASRIGTVIFQRQGPFPHEGRYTHRPLQAAIEDDLPYVEQVVQTASRVQVRDVARVDGAGLVIADQKVLSATSGFFEMFSFPLRRGDPATVLSAPQSAVVTASQSQAFFGDANPIGRQIRLTLDSKSEVYTVTGVAEPPPRTSTFDFDVVVTEDSDPSETGWQAAKWHTYALLQPGIDMSRFGEDVEAVARANNAIAGKTTISAISIDDLYLSEYFDAGDAFGSRWLVQLFGVVGLLTLLVAAVNFVNLATAETARRATSVGIRRSLGATRSQVSLEAAVEPVVFALTSLVLSVFVVVTALKVSIPLFGEVQSGLAHDLVPHLLKASAVAVGLVTLATVLPYVSLTRLQPVDILRGESVFQATRGRGSVLRRSLMAYQFTVTVGLIMVTLIIGHQLRFLMEPDRGFDSERLVALELGMDVSQERLRDIASLAETIPEVERVAVSGSIPGRFNVGMGARQSDVTSASVPRPDGIISLRPSEVDTNYIPTLGLSLAAGRNFREGDHPSETFIINQTTARSLGWSDEEAIGKPFRIAFGEMGKIIGVVEDFQVASMKSEIAPVVLVQENDSFSSSPHVSMRLADAAATGFIDDLRRRIPQETGVEVAGVHDLDASFDAMYRSEMRTGAAIFGFSLATILVSCLGLYGFMLVIIRQRERELAIRRALGATVRHIVSLIGSEIAVSVVVSAVLGCGAAWYLGSVWLQQFSYTIDLSLGIPALTVATVSLLVASTVLTSCYRTLSQHPADALRQA